jgi:hypothetical protein
MLALNVARKNYILLEELADRPIPKNKILAQA